MSNRNTKIYANEKIRKYGTSNKFYDRKCNPNIVRGSAVNIYNNVNTLIKTCDVGIIKRWRYKCVEVCIYGDWPERRLNPHLQ